MNTNTFSGFLAVATLSLETIETHLRENDGSMVELDQGKTFLTVLFRQV